MSENKIMCACGGVCGGECRLHNLYRPRKNNEICPSAYIIQDKPKDITDRVWDDEGYDQ